MVVNGLVERVFNGDIERVANNIWRENAGD